MPKQNIPVYAIVELLMRLSHYNKLIGDYRGHTAMADNVLVKTTGGSINFTQTFIMQQFEKPEMISHNELLKAAATFMPARSRQKSIS